MQRVFLLAVAGIAALAVALPATVGAATFKGVVIAKKQARHTLVTASPNGVVRTTRLHGSLTRFRVGRVVGIQAASLPDGTFAASKVRLLGSASAARFRGAVVAASAKTLTLSAGLSVITLALRSGNASSLKAGDSLAVGASLRGGALKTSMDKIRKVGHEDTLELEGIYLATADDGTIELAVEHRGRVYVHVPDDMIVPDFTPGDVIALQVKVEHDGTFTLIKVDDENDGDGDGDGGGIDGEKFYVAGVLSEVNSSEVTVNIDGDDDRPASCKVPAAFNLSGFEVGQRVYMACKFGDGHRILVALRKQEAGSEYLIAVGHIIDITDDSVTVQGDGDPVECALTDESDLSDFEVGDGVVMKCVKVDGVWTLSAIQKRDLSPPPPPPPPPPSYVLASGSIAALSTSITVQGEHDPVTCTIPDGADLSAFHVTDHVYMKCLVTPDGLRLKRLQSATALYEAP
jgi:hypothetical protein